MIRTLLLGTVLLLGYVSRAQTYGNEWIDLGKRYWSFKVEREGVFRIDSTALANAGFPVATVDPRHLQVFGREEQVPIHVEGDTDGVFNSADFIEFYAKGNDGWLDSALWESPEYISNPYISQINDTIRYFLTWDPGPGLKSRVVDHVQADYTSLPAHPWFFCEARHWSINYYGIGQRSVVGASTSRLGTGEGHVRRAMANGTSTSYTAGVPTARPLITPEAPPARITSTFVGLNSASKDQCPDHHVVVSAGVADQVFLDTIYQGYSVIKYDFEAPAAAVVHGFTPVKYSVPHDLTPCGPMSEDYPDWLGVATTRILYPRVWRMNNQLNFHMYIPQVDGQAYANVKCSEVGSGYFYVLEDTVKRSRLAPNPTGPRSNIPLRPDGEDTHVFFTNENGIAAIDRLQPVNGTGYFRDLLATPFDSALIIVTHASLLEASQEYAASRAMSTVAPSNPYVVDVAELYMQHGGGVFRHPLAIRRFMQRLHDLATVPPKALFLVGKSVQAPRVEGDPGHRVDTLAARQCLVPTMGYPCSDVLFTLGISGDPTDLTIPVGRLAARTPQQVLDYRDKLEGLEAQQPAAWMKDVLHFRGGSTPAEVLMFNSALDSYKDEVEDTLFMGRVIKFQKQGDQPITGAPADSVRSFIENGVTLMTFFAHAFGENFDITISEPDLYEWSDRFPVMLGNSCYTGNIHKYTGVSASERFVLGDGVGAIAFLSSVDLGLAQYLTPFTRDFYKSFCEVNYGRGIGEHLRYATAQQLMWGGDQDINLLNNVQTFTLHGDPTVVMNSPPLPDLEVRDADVRVIPDVVTAELDSFQVRVIIRNIGRGTHAPFTVAIDRSQVNSAAPAFTYLGQLALQHYQDTITFTLPVIGNGFGPGLNDLRVRVDMAPDVIVESDDVMNNRAGALLQIISGELIPVYPYDLSVVPNVAPHLRASTGDPFAPARNYLFQIDTTDTFDSPAMEQTSVNAPGGVIEWQPASIYDLNASNDSLVFYWRTTLDSAGSGLFNWRQQSFQYIPGKRGWGQAHFLQFKPNRFDLLQYDLPGREFEFFSGTKEISVSLTGNSPFDCQWSVDLEPQEYAGCTSAPALHVGVVDPVGFTTWQSLYQGVGRSFGNLNINGACRQRNERYFIFNQRVPAQMDSLADMLNNDIPDGHFVVVYTYLRLDRDTVQQTAAWSALAAAGAESLTNGTVQDSVPYILLFRKGDPSSAIEKWGDSPTASIDTAMQIVINARTASMGAPRAGVMEHWEELSWYAEPGEPSDSLSVSLSGFNATSPVAQPLITFHGSSGAVTPLDPLASAQLYPYLRLDARFSSQQVLGPRPLQLKRWHLLGSPVPECAIDPPSGFHTYLDGIFQGEQASAMVAIRNIGDLPMDSLLVAAWAVGADNQRHLVHYRRNGPLPVGAVLQDTVRFSTTALGGPTALVIEANPLDSITDTYDQPEQFHGNNVATIRFNTVADRIQPVLDVTFDGIHILNGDIVSARPEIEMMLDDENPVLLMDSPADTACFKVFLTRPDGQMEIVPFVRNGQEIMRFLPAGGDDNICRIKYQGRFEQDGKYKLLITAKDKSSNASSTRDHTVEFEVINRPTITEVLNYPNPFTTSTRFVFTLTGHERPTALRIQIMTVTGRVVREIAMHELGDLRVGRNITDYAWDGTDQFGDKLARGVYLYRVMAQLNGQDIEYRETAAGSLFTKGFGKMYLLR